VVRIAHQPLQIEWRGVVKKLSGLTEQEGLRIKSGLLARLLLFEHGGLSGLQDAVQAPQHGEGQDHLAVFRLLVITAQQIGHGPDKRGEVEISHVVSRYISMPADVRRHSFLLFR